MTRGCLTQMVPIYRGRESEDFLGCVGFCWFCCSFFFSFFLFLFYEEFGFFTPLFSVTTGEIPPSSWLMK